MQEWTLDSFEQSLKEDEASAFYLYSSMCGTCQVASKMLTIVEQLLPDYPMGQANLNFHAAIAEKYQVESVPCLIIQRGGQVQKKIYAFQSVPYLLEQLKGE